MVPSPQTTPQPRRSLPPPTWLPRESTLLSTLDFTLESARLRPSPMPIWATVSPTPTEVSTAHITLVVFTTLESVTPRPTLMPIWATVSPTAVSTAHTPPLAVTTTLESVMLRPSPMPIWATVSPTAVSTAHTPPLEATTTLESVTPRPSPGATTVSPTEVSTEDGPMSTKEELLSSGL